MQKLIQQYSCVNDLICELTECGASKDTIDKAIAQYEKEREQAMVEYLISEEKLKQSEVVK